MINSGDEFAMFPTIEENKNFLRNNANNSTTANSVESVRSAQVSCLKDSYMLDHKLNLQLSSLNVFFSLSWLSTGLPCGRSQVQTSTGLTLRVFK